MRKKLFVFMVAFAVVSSPAFTQQSTTSGLITKIDPKAGTISIQHDQLGSVGTGNADVTEEFKVADGLIFNAVQVGDKIHFAFDQVNGVKTLTKLERGQN